MTTMVESGHGDSVSRSWNPVTPGESRLTAATAPAALFVIALVISLYRVGASGPLWPDSPRYANGAAMIRDWLVSGNLLSPYRFALANYAQYPAFSIPYHPPAYPGMLALLFLVTGTSYVAARAFVAASLGGAACVFYAVQRRFGVGRAAAFASGLVLLTTPDVARWGRDTMSEVPSLAVFLVASYLFLVWLDSGRPAHCWMAFGVAAVAFLCRVTTLGLVPGWLGFALGTVRGRRLKSPHLIAALATYLAMAAVYLRFSSRFSRYETGADGRSEGLSWSGLSYFAECLPQMATWGTSVVGLVGLIGFAVYARRSPVGRFWLSWLLSYTAFKLLVPTSPEVRYLFAALPALAGLAACLLGEGVPKPFARGLGQATVAIGLVLNLTLLVTLPRGLVGHEPVAASLAAQQGAGNVLLACPYDQDLIFRYRAHAPGSRRMFIRGDRTLAIRLAGYARVAARTLATKPEDLLDAVRRGRVRYLVTADDPDPFIGSEEMTLAHRTAVSRPGDFALLSQNPVIDRGIGPGRWYWVYVWAYQGELPDGPSELPVVIPTADLTVTPAVNTGRRSPTPPVRPTR
jgi:hypothetical protein